MMRKIIKIILLVAILGLVTLGTICSWTLLVVSVESLHIYRVMIGLILSIWLSVVGVGLVAKILKTIVTV
jgi:hypothetical protein